MRSALALCLALALAVPAHASAPKSDADAPAHMDISPIAAPILLNGRLVNYVFVTIRLVAKPGSDPQSLRRYEPFIRDAIVRSSYRTALNAPDQLTRVDEKRVNALALAEARRIAGPKSFIASEVKQQAPKRVSGLPSVKPTS